MIRKTVAACLIGALVFLSASARQSSTADQSVGRVIGEVFANGQHMKYLSLLSDEIGQRLTRDEVKKMASDTKVGEQWRAAGIWP